MRRSAESNARRAAAALAGAIEGFLNAIDEYDLAGSVEESAQVAGEVAREATSAGVSEADTPEMRQMGRAVRDTTRSATDAVTGAATNAKDAVKTTAQDVSYAVKEKVEDVKDAAHNFQEEVKVRADAVGESARRAKAAPGRVGREFRGAVRAWWGGLTTSMAMWMLIGVIALTTWILLTITLVVALNKVLFDPLGTFLVVVLYAIAAGICYAVAKSRRAAAQKETQRRMANSREEIRRVGRPVREAFAGRGRAGY